MSDQLPKRRRWRKIVALVAPIVVLAAFGGVASATSNAVKSAAADPIAFLNAPADATPVAFAPSAVITTPVTHEKVSLNWGKAYPVPAGPIGDPKKTYTFCFSQGLLNNPWVTAQRESVMIEAARHPNLKVLYFNTNDANQQVQDLQTCHNKHVDAILVWPQTVGALTPEVNRLCKSDVVIGMERTVATRCYTSWLFLDYPGTVTAVGEAVAKATGGKGVVVESQGSPGSSPAILRHKYFADVMKKYPGIKLVQTNPTDFGLTTGYNAAITFLNSAQGKGPIAAWYSHYEQEALGIAAALKQKGRTDVKQFTIGGTRQVICEVEKGKIAYLHPGSATPLHGDLAVRLAIMKVEGKKIPGNVSLSSPPPITPANAKAAYLTEGWGPGC